MVCLFTNVPVDLALRVAEQRLRQDGTLADRTALEVEEVVQLLDFCLNATYFAFRGSFFQQTFGTAMGSPVSVTVANLVMESIEERALESFNVPVRFWKRYVDDACTALPSHKVQDLLCHLNTTEESINFTVEVEVEGKLPFLDVNLHHAMDGTISATVYRKPTHTGLYLNFTSHHPLEHKLSVIKTLHHRAQSIVSSPADQTQRRSLTH